MHQVRLAGTGTLFSTFDGHQTSEQDILTKTEPTLMQLGITCPRGKSMKRSTLGVRRSKIKVT